MSSSRMPMRISNNSGMPPHFLRATPTTGTSPQTQLLRSANQARSTGGLNDMGMINRVRFAKSGCSSCGGGR